MRSTGLENRQLHYCATNNQCPVLQIRHLKRFGTLKIARRRLTDVHRAKQRPLELTLAPFVSERRHPRPPESGREPAGSLRDHIETERGFMFKHAVQTGIEGVVGNARTLLTRGRKNDWLKAKPTGYHHGRERPLRGRAAPSPAASVAVCM